MKPILFSIGKVNIYAYGLMFALGIIGGVWLAMHLAKKRGYDTDFFFNLAVYVVIFGFIGSKLLHLITVWDELMADPLGTLKDSISQGFVVYGSSIAGILTIIIYCRKKKKNMWRYLDVTMPGLALGQAIGRIGCYLSGCCYGMEYDGFGAVVFPQGCSAPSGVSLFPSQLVSCAANLLLMVVLLIFLNKNRIKGRVTALWLILYSAGRGVIEIFRNDPRGAVGPFSTSQFISLFLFVIGVVLFIYLSVAKKQSLEDVYGVEDEAEAEDGKE